MTLVIKESALASFQKNLLSTDRILVTGARGWFGRTALAMITPSKLPILATGSRDGFVSSGNLEQSIVQQNLDLIRAFEPTVVIDTAFLTREKLGSIGYRQYVKTNNELIADSLILASLRTVRKYIGFSSGATKHLAGHKSFSKSENPYAAQKRYYEKRMKQLIESGNSGISISRVWSVSGGYTTKPSAYAFSNLILQAQTGVIKIQSKLPLFRRYCSIEDVLSIALSDHQGFFDTGGQLVEIGDLADIIKKEINPQARIVRSSLNNARAENYYSDNKDWARLIEANKLGEDTLADQIRRVAKSLRRP
jgi:nucleoside-diphosphate-sugar epimerase